MPSGVRAFYAGDCSPGTSRLYGLGISRAQKPKSRGMAARSEALHNVCIFPSLSGFSPEDSSRVPCLDRDEINQFQKIITAKKLDEIINKWMLSEIFSSVVKDLLPRVIYCIIRTAIFWADLGAWRWRNAGKGGCGMLLRFAFRNFNCQHQAICAWKFTTLQRQTTFQLLASPFDEISEQLARVRRIGLFSNSARLSSIGLTHVGLVGPPVIPHRMVQATQPEWILWYYWTPSSSSTHRFVLKISQAFSDVLRLDSLMSACLDHPVMKQWRAAWLAHYERTRHAPHEHPIKSWTAAKPGLPHR